MGRFRKKKHRCKIFRHHGHCFPRKCHEGKAIVNQLFRTGTISGVTNVIVPVFTNIGDATVFNRSNANGFLNIV